MANSESEFEDETRNDDQISEKELDCNLCEKRFQDLIKLRQHTMKCIMDQDFEASNSIEKQMDIQPTEDKEKHLNDEFSFPQEDQLNKIDNKCVIKDNRENDLAAIITVNSSINHLEKEENEEADSMNATYSFVNFPKETDALNCTLCGKPFANLAQIREHTLTCLDKNNDSNVEMDYDESTQEEAVKEEVKEEVEDQTYDNGMEYFFEPEVETDMENEAIDKQVQCEQCKKIFPKRRSMMYHVKMVHGTNPVVCDICCKTFANSRYLKSHTSNVHRTERDPNSESGTGNDIVELKCPMCPKSYLKKYSLRGHMRTFHVKEESVCDFCSKVFQNRKFLQNHIRKVHTTTNELYECEECNKQFKSKLSRTEHIRQVHSIDFVSCETCSKEFKNKATLGKHVLNIHGGTKSEDDASSEKEINYMRRLLEREKRECDQCPKVFEKNIYLKRHIRSVHSTSDTLFPCEHCGKEFINTERRGIHINMVHVINEVSCEACGKVYKNKTMLGKHASRSKSCYRPQT